MSRKVGGGLKTWIFFFLITGIPILATFWMAASTFSPRKNEKAKLPGRPIDHYLTFHKEEDREKYYGRNKIPMETFHEKYFDGDVDFKGDPLDVLEYRHDWATFRFTISLMWFFVTGMMPEVILHTRSQGPWRQALDFRPLLICAQMRSKSAIITIAGMTFTDGS
jgi:sphingolipid C9-methyltransferase